ncbi:MAG: RpiB/LacA/LacB family sugar-phosphate isomerase [Alphaproteobacteria bacterium]|nr:RpiB/LacA/LacB family sugar-phosphate isomerase [Alphaproteobacteria bacterium]
MKIALVSDEFHPVHNVVIDWLKDHDHQLFLFGALKSGHVEESWVAPTAEAAHAIQTGKCQEGIFFCWTGTGVSIVANKVPGIRAALCTDAETARGARVWNHANVLALSNRLLSQDVAKEILTAWFEDFDAQKGETGVDELTAFENAVS